MIVFVSNFFNHHQRPLAINLYKLTNGQFRFIETQEMPDGFKQNGYLKFQDNFIIRAWQSEEKLSEARSLIIDADVVLWGGWLDYQTLKRRLDLNKLTFDVGERWLKRGLVNLLSPRLLKLQYFYHRFFYNKPYYRLNASGFAAYDLKSLHSFKDKMFKWGYFIDVPEHDIYSIIKTQKQNPVIRIAHIARFLSWKHHEMSVMLAKELKSRGVEFEMNLFGSGPTFEKIKTLISKLELEDNIKLRGNLPNEELMQELQRHHILIFPSDKNEGWGAVVGEAMSHGCAVVTSDKVGAAPFLIKHGENGLCFKDRNIKDLVDKTMFLIQNPDERERMVVNAYRTMKNEWSPANAAHNLMSLIHYLSTGNGQAPKQGPASDNTVKLSHL